MGRKRTPNHVTIGDGAAIIHIPNGSPAIIDACDYDVVVASLRWHRNGSGRRAYVKSSLSVRGIKISLHRLIADLMGLSNATHVDHIDHDPLNNQRSNLRAASHSESEMNRRSYRGSSAFKGVSWDKQRGKWRAAIGRDKQRFHLGFFESEPEAACAYNDAAVRLHGTFACLNVNPAIPGQQQGRKEIP